MASDLSSEFECKCGQEGWIGDGERTEPCPRCGRVYEGRYSAKLLGIEAVEVSEESDQT